MLLSHKIALAPTAEQEAYFRRACGTARFVYNWGLDRWKKWYEGWKELSEDQKKTTSKPSKEALGKILRRAVMFNPGWFWLREVDSHIPTGALRNLGAAFANTFRRLKQGQKPGFPNFKKKGIHDSFYVHNRCMEFNGKRLLLRRGKITGPTTIKMREVLRFEGKIQGGAISREADRWFIAVQVEVKDYAKPRTADKKVGIDLGVLRAVTTSEQGIVYDSPKPLKTMLYRLKRKSRQLTKKKKGSANRERARNQLARLHRDIRNIRQDFLHKTTTQLCSENQAIMIEDLNVKGMLANRRVARAIGDIGMFEFRRQLDYKTKIYGSELVVADRWFASSRTCSKCGSKKDELKLSERVFRCSSCGLEIDRDLNAAINLLNYPEAQGK
ncbi:IS200/IS605 family element transposase accessory protein TnpB [bacterium]|nr:IS200/IS605 family element transposase accessory protein TnpB [bacterium]